LRKSIECASPWLTEPYSYTWTHAEPMGTFAYTSHKRSGVARKSGLSALRPIFALDGTIGLVQMTELLSPARATVISNRRDLYIPQGYLRGFVDPGRKDLPRPL